MSENDELKILIQEAKQKAAFEKSQERPARENVDALLAEAAERRARMQGIQRQMREVETLIERTDKRINVIFIICFIALTLLALGFFAGVIVDLFFGKG